jgi:hypothetical protein
MNFDGCAQGLFTFLHFPSLMRSIKIKKIIEARVKRLFNSTQNAMTIGYQESEGENVLKSKFAAIAMAAVLLSQVGVGAFADEAKSANGPWTTSNNAAWQFTSFPLRVVSGASGILLGALTGGVKGIASTEEQFAQKTFGKAHENPMMVPVGLVGTVVALPVGFVTGAPDGAVAGGKYGYHIWDSF